MAASATARRVAATPARRATAARSSLKQRPRPRQQPRRRRRGSTPAGGFVPVVVGRTAGAVGGIADSGLVVRMTRGRLWIGVLGALLVGIVALNVWALGLNASSSKVARQTDSLKRANSALQAEIAGELSNERVQAAATTLGLIVPEPGAIGYLDTGNATAAIAARRLEDGDFTIGVVPPPVTPAPVAEAPIVPEETTAPVATVPDPAAVDPAAAAAPPVAPGTVATAGGIGVP